MPSPLRWALRTATAALIGRFATGVASDLAACILLATRAPILIAPAMNDAMYENPIVQGNIDKLRELDVAFVDPEVGRLACGVEGKGRLAEVGRIEQAALDLLGGQEGPAR